MKIIKRLSGILMAGGLGLTNLLQLPLASAIPVPSLVRMHVPFCEGVNERGYFPPLTLANRADWVNPNLAMGSNVLARKIYLPFWNHLGKGIAADYDSPLGSWSDSAVLSNSLHTGSLEQVPGSTTSTVDKPFVGGKSDTINYRIPGLAVTVCQVNSRPKVEYQFTDRVSLLSFLHQMFAKGINIKVLLHRGEQLTPMATGGMAITKIYHVPNPIVKFIYDTKGMVYDYFPAPVVFDADNHFVAAEFVKTGYNTFRLDTDFVHQQVKFPVRIRFGWARSLPDTLRHKFPGYWKNNTLADLEDQTWK